MRWVLLDLLIALAALGWLAARALRVWRSVKQLGAEVSSASARLGVAGDALAEVQSHTPSEASRGVG